MGPSYAGLLPISNDPNETRQVSSADLSFGRDLFDEVHAAVLLVFPAERARQRTRPDILVSSFLRPSHRQLTDCESHKGLMVVLDAHHSRASCKKTGYVL